MAFEVWKYKVPCGNVSQYEFSLSLPAGASALTVQTQEGEAQMWVLIDTNQIDNEEERKFVLLGTGEAYANASYLTYVGTYQAREGSYVGHVFEVLG